VNEASAVLRAAVRDTIRKRSLLFLAQAGVMVVAGILALLFLLFAGTGLVRLLGWMLILSPTSGCSSSASRSSSSSVTCSSAIPPPGS
jgi:uncharacterized membrane protein HdeD (DUF308 family)